jgi:predicted nucleic acid-binding protein
MYIIDTNVVSELRKKSGGKANRRVVAWSESVPFAGIFISSITVLELERGVLLVERRDATQGRLCRHF